MRNLLLLTTMMLALLATPVAFAQDTNNETPEDAAWVEDCPPDMMCAASEDQPNEFGPEGCIDCTQAPGETCMDGASETEICDSDVQYLGGPSGEPQMGGVEGSAAGERSVPGASFFVVAAAFAIAIVVLARRG